MNFRVYYTMTTKEAGTEIELRESALVKSADSPEHARNTVVKARKTPHNTIRIRKIKKVTG